MNCQLPWAVGQFQIKGDFDSNTSTYTINGQSYKLLTWIHTHPGRVGATSMGRSDLSQSDRDIVRFPRLVL